MKRNTILRILFNVVGLVAIIVQIGMLGTNDQKLEKLCKDASEKRYEYYNNQLLEMEKSTNGRKVKQGNDDHFEEIEKDTPEVKLPAVDIALGRQTYDFSQLSHFDGMFEKYDPMPDNKDYDRRYVSDSGTFSFLVPKGSTAVRAQSQETEIYDVYDESGIKFMTVSRIPSQTVYYELGITDTMSFITNARNDIQDRFKESYITIGKVHNSHVILTGVDISGDIGGSAVAYVQDGFNNIYAISSNDLSKMPIYKAAINIELFESEGFRFINSPNRDTIYMQKINSVEYYE